MKTDKNKFCSLSEPGMNEAASCLGSTLAGGDVIALVGHLGAGKTHFTKGLVSGLGGNPEGVTSPTFSLVNEYRGSQFSIYHFDFYRMETAEEVLRIGWEEYLDDKGAVVIVEWADKFEELLPEETEWLRIEIAKDGTRNIFRNV